MLDIASTGVMMLRNVDNYVANDTAYRLTGQILSNNEVRISNLPESLNDKIII